MIVLHAFILGEHRRTEPGVDLKQLAAVLRVAETGSLIKAAQLLHLAQSAATRKILGLEEELGVALFDRSRQGMRPTEAGRTLNERARRAISERERARAEVRPAPG
ncbi:LysR family transcriptional regulator [Streptomyces sp. NPDC026589]|uniref:LysR family transcriptional regulator n=1 Tax=Streptomyces sp. NPDC026589 TaxID=3155609 RepID=UPI0033C8EB0F